MKSHISPSGRQTGNSPPHFIHREVQAERGRLMHRCHIYESNQGHIGYSDPNFSNNIFRCSWQQLPLYTAFHVKLEKYFMDEEIGKLRRE